MEMLFESLNLLQDFTDYFFVDNSLLASQL